jgi:hypothetical protein
MTAYDDIGNVIDTKTLNIIVYEKVVGMALNLFSQDISNTTYISYSSGGVFVRPSFFFVRQAWRVASFDAISTVVVAVG